MGTVCYLKLYVIWKKSEFLSIILFLKFFFIDFSSFLCFILSNFVICFYSFDCAWSNSFTTHSSLAEVVKSMPLICRPHHVATMYSLFMSDTNSFWESSQLVNIIWFHVFISINVYFFLRKWDVKLFLCNSLKS